MSGQITKRRRDKKRESELRLREREERRGGRGGRGQDAAEKESAW
jgi:hypothetical protein